MNRDDIVLKDGNTIVNFSNSILKHFNCKTHHKTIEAVDRALEGHKKVVVMLFDGMGSYLQETHLKEKGYIRSHFLKSMEATYPPTTVASTNGLLSGLYPIENGWLSWSNYFPDYDKSIEMFKNTNYHKRGEKIIPSNYNVSRVYYPYESIFEQIKKKNPDTIVATVNDRQIDKDGYKNFSEASKQLDKILSQDKSSFTYFYYTNPDEYIHQYGVHHPMVAGMIHKIEKFVKKITKKYPDTLFFVIADHGLIDVEYEIMSEKEDICRLQTRPFTYEGRTSGFYVKKENQKEFISLFNKYYGDNFILMTTKEAKAKGIFGFGKDHPNLKNTWPDFISVAVGNKIFSYEERKHLLKGHHAGYTRDEMSINISCFNK